MAKARPARSEFARRFRRGAFGWKSQPAIARARRAVSEIKAATRHDPVVAAGGAVLFLERVSPALEHVDSSSGAIGTAGNNAIEELVAIIASAPADANTRARCLDRLWEAHASDTRRNSHCLRSCRRPAGAARPARSASGARPAPVPRAANCGMARSASGSVQGVRAMVTRVRGWATGAGTRSCWLQSAASLK
jgi:hypothetical protein